MKALGGLVVVALLSWAVQAPPAHAASAAYKIVTANKTGTYYAIASDLAKMVAPRADIDLEVLATSGSAENMKLLRQEPGIKLAIVQADVYQAFVDLAGDNREAARIIRPMRGSTGSRANVQRAGRTSGRPQINRIRAARHVDLSHVGDSQ